MLSARARPVRAAGDPDDDRARVHADVNQFLLALVMGLQRGQAHRAARVAFFQAHTSDLTLLAAGSVIVAIVYVFLQRGHLTPVHVMGAVKG